MKYCFGVIVDDNSNFNKIVKKFDDINALMELRTPPPDEEGNTYESYYALAGVTPEIRVESHIVVNAHVPQALKNKVQGEGGNTLKGSKIMWFEGTNYTYDYLRQRLLQWAGEDGCDKIWVIDQDTDLTVNSPQELANKFVTFY
jgi:hypothetical protein